jgi:hypothetical protein
MTVNHRTDHVLARAGTFRPQDTGRLNDILEAAGLGRPLGDPAAGQGPLLSVPVRGGADPVAIQAAVQAAIAAAGPQPAPPALIANPVSAAGTVATGDFFASGKKSGHGMGWVPAPADEMPPKPSWDPDRPHRVIALLDSGVQPHFWLPGGHLSVALLTDTDTDTDPDGDGGGPAPAPDDPPFLIDADGLDGWHSPVEPDNPSGPHFPPGTHWGHGTFIAGLIRQAAPHAQVLSMRVMDSRGHADDHAVVGALRWLSRTTAVRADIVLMAFGRLAAPVADETLDDLRQAVKALTGTGVQVIASAGNNGSDRPVYPAAFAAEGIPVVSVGALVSAEERAPYSNFGPWVTTAWLGTDIVSISPQTVRNAGDRQADESAVINPGKVVAEDSFAWWTGTSFAAALAAGRLASGKAAGLPLPSKVAQP